MYSENNIEKEEGGDLDRLSFNGKLYFILTLIFLEIRYNEQEDSDICYNVSLLRI